MGKKKVVGGQHISLVQLTWYGSFIQNTWCGRFIDNLWPFDKGKWFFLSVLGDCGLGVLYLLLLEAISLLSLGCHKGSEPVIVFWLILIVFLCFTFCTYGIIMFGAQWLKEYALITIISYSLHLFYILLMLNTFIEYFDVLIKKPNLAAAYMCLLFLFLVEATALFFYVYDVMRNREGDPPSRWWIRTMPYALMGVIFLGIFLLMKVYESEGSGYSLFYSMAVSVLAVNYLVQIINERIVPKDGPYKETCMAVCNRSIHARPAYHRPAYHRPVPRRAHARRSKLSPSAGRGEGAC